MTPVHALFTERGPGDTGDAKQDNAMYFSATYEWQSKLVATSQGTAVMAYEFADAFFSDTFNAPGFNEWYGRNFVNLLDELLAAKKNNERRVWVLEWSDDTGTARLEIRC